MNKGAFMAEAGQSLRMVLNSQAHKFLHPAIFYLSDTDGNLIETVFSGPVSDAMKEDFAEHLSGKTLPSYSYVAAELTLPLTSARMKAFVTMFYNADCAKSEADLYINKAAKAAEDILLVLADAGTQKQAHEKENARGCMMSEILKSAEYSDRLDKFTESFIDYIKKYTSSGDNAFIYIKDPFRTMFSVYGTASRSELADRPVPQLNEKIFYEADNARVCDVPHIIEKKDIQNTGFSRRILFNDYFIIPVYDGRECMGLVLFFNATASCRREAQKELLTLVNEAGPWIRKLIKTRQMNEEKRRKDILLKVSRKFYISKDPGDILKEILTALEYTYPDFNVLMRLSNEWEVAGAASVHLLDLHHEPDSPGTKAYVSGTLQVLDSLKKKMTTLYVPLKGRQGVYGILELETESSRIFPDAELEFIQFLADTGGNAIENAELYQQSRQYNNDLRLINETSSEMNENLNVTEAAKLLVTKTDKVFKADLTGFMLITGEGTAKKSVWSGSNSDAVSGHPAFLDVMDTLIKERKEVFISDWSKTCSDVPYKSLMGVPVVHKDKVVGIIVCLSQSTYAFTFDAFKLFRALVHHSSLAVANAVLHEAMNELVVTDYVTKLYTRKFLDEKVTEAMVNDGYGSFMLLDIDHFKLINDQYGHQTGDEVLVQVAHIIRSHTKKDRDLPARWGGEEIAVYFPGTKAEEAEKAADRIRDAVKLKTEPSITVSCGVSSWSSSDGPPSMSLLFRQADEALYKAKNSGRDAVAVAPSPAGISNEPGW